MRVSKIVISKIEGFLCLEYDCWPEEHPGCVRRYDIGCDGCPKSIKKITVGKSVERDNFSEAPFYRFPSTYIPISQKKIVNIRSLLHEYDNYQQSY